MIDPTTVGAVAAAILAVLVAAYPILSLMQKWSANKATAAASSAEASLYEHLTEQLAQNTAALNRTYAERNDLITRYASMEVRMAALENIERFAETLKARLDEKDNDIQEKDKIIEEQVERMRQLVDEVISKSNKIEEQNGEISRLKERVHQLELRLVKDEADWCRGCAYRGSSSDQISHDTPESA